MFTNIKKKIINARAEDAILYEIVLDEMESGDINRGLWAKAVAFSDGDDNKAKSQYMQYRVQSIRDYFDSLKIMAKELEKDKLIKLVKSSNNHRDTVLSERFVNLDTQQNMTDKSNNNIEDIAARGSTEAKLAYQYNRSQKPEANTNKNEPSNFIRLFSLILIVVLTIIWFIYELNK